MSPQPENKLIVKGRCPGNLSPGYIGSFILPGSVVLPPYNRVIPLIPGDESGRASGAPVAMVRVRSSEYLGDNTVGEYEVASSLVNAGSCARYVPPRASVQ